MQTAHLPHPLRVIRIIDENDYTKTLVFDHTIDANPGQFVMAWLPGHEDKPFSLLKADPLSLTIAAVGPFSRAVHQLQVGDSLWVRGPLGQGFTLPAEPTRILCIGGGYGVAPLQFLTRQALAQGHTVTMVIGARSSGDLLLVDAFKTLGISLWITTEDGSMGLKGRVTDAISQIIGQRTQPTIAYACGPTGMLEAVAAQCSPEGIAVQLAWEAHMRCGIGLCGSCEVGDGWLTCLDGPMFTFNPRLVGPFAEA